jgi:hypothetical protein
MRGINLHLPKKCILLIAGFIFASLSWQTQQAEAQALRVVASNTFAGAATGAMLGGAQMALNNDDDTMPLRYGVGIGTLAGMAVGVYDTGREADAILYGTFRSTRHTGSIIMMDTFLGAATGAVVGMAVALLRQDEIVKGVQYGAGAGAWAGFGFGLIDGFFLREYDRERGYVSSFSQTPGKDSANGLLSLQTNSNLSIGFINPSLYSYPDLENERLNIRNSWGVELTNVSVSF